MSPDLAALQPLVRDLAKLLVDAIRDQLATLVPSDKSDAMLPADVARVLKVSPRKVYGWIETKRLKASNLNPSGSKRPRYSIERADFEAFRQSLQPTPVTARRLRKPQSSTKRY